MFNLLSVEESVTFKWFIIRTSDLLPCYIFLRFSILGLRMSVVFVLVNICATGFVGNIAK